MSDETKKRLSKRIVGVLVAAGVIGLLTLLVRNLSRFDYDSIVEIVKSYPVSAIGLAVVFTVFSYAMMGGYDWLGQRYVGRQVNWKRTMLVAFYSYVLSLNIGLSIVSSSAVRYKMYQNWGYSGKDIAKLIVFASVSFWLGLAVLAGASLAFTQVQFDGAYPIPDLLVKPVGGLMVLLGVAYVVLCAVGKGSIRVRGREISLPGWKAGVGQIGITAIDTVAAASALYVLIPDDQLSYAAFLGIFCIAFFGGLVSSAPGGIGVFESVFILFLPTTASQNELMAALLVYRAIYFLLPLMAACLMFAGLEGRSFAGKYSPQLTNMQGWLSSIAPRVFSTLTFVVGIVLLLSGSLPSSSRHVEWIQAVLPLAFLEMSHFIVSLVGLMLLVLAYGIKKRIDSAYYLTLGAIAISAPLSVLRGDGVVTFALLGVMGLTLLPCRRYFYRKSSLVHMKLGVGSLGAIAVALFCTIYVGIFIYHHGAYEDQSWWRFEFDNERPRFLRTSFGIALLGVLFAVYKIVDTARPVAGYALEDCNEIVKRILATSDVASANLALMGDKRFYFDAEEKAFIMFRIKGKTWVAMGDPVGDRHVFKNLIESFREYCSSFGGTPVFYQTSKEHLHNYVDLGLQAVKVGELARVRLEDFSLEGSKRQSMRSRLKRVEKKGASFEVLGQREALLAMERLRAISDEWLKDKNAREKGFSLGYFDDRYLSHFRIAVVKSEGEIVAFTNIWESAGKKELSIDLMRYSKEAPPSVMEYLFVELMKWAKEEGFEWFDLRVAPLSGMSVGNSAPLSSKLLDLVFNHGESFYGFRGLRAYKDRFGPEWEGTYIASPGGWRMPIVTVDLTRVVSAKPPKTPTSGGLN